MPDRALFDAHTLVTYSLAAFALVLTPGPNQALVISRSVEGGVRSGLLTSLGVQIGTLVHTLAAALGLSAILATSALAFAFVKYTGAAYLIVLGLVLILKTRRSPGDGHAAIVDDVGPGGRLVFHAAMTGILNPKVAVFFLAFLPQFVQPARGSALLQFVALGLILSALGFACDAALALLATRVRTQLVSSARFIAWRERLTGGVLIGLGLRLATADRR